MCAAEQKRAPSTTPRLQFVLLWVAATGAGFLLGALSGGVLEFLFFYRSTTTASGYESSIAGVQVIPLGLSIGVALATILQARLVRGFVAPWAWGTTGILAGAIGVASTAVAGLLTPNTGALPGWSSYYSVAAAVAVVLAVAQAILWRARPRRALLWFGATLFTWAISLPLGWVAGLVFGFPLAMIASLVVGGGPGGIIGAGMIVVGAGVVQGVLGGAVFSLRIHSQAGFI